ncbi:A disintegrin and metalloproteinase with thrombospondin motifs 18-like [Mercenaria mercenaria]|uniref:A disintegrin and metalloproteinase with thrombospondin motifs 18-like n=1 Tax=Mercenaria mercenaria TaxID=6596 RepID=UPI00234F6B6E|nr:A disintegrin and metalloproteinase with thrombospondin motifs 18-like [Mercenaria mercenaria]
MKQCVGVFTQIGILIIFICAIKGSLASDGNNIPQEFEVVLPKVFQHDSADISISNIRQRRSITSEVFINITTHQDTFHVKLKPNLDLLAPSFKIYHRHGNADNMTDDVTVESDDITDIECLYKGEVVSHDGAPAAFSLCNGLTGVLMFPHDDFVIEPLPSHMSSLHKNRHHHGNSQHRSHDYNPHRSNGNNHQRKHSKSYNHQHLYDLDTTANKKTWPEDSSNIRHDNDNHDSESGSHDNTSSNLGSISGNYGNISRNHDKQSSNQTFRVSSEASDNENDNVSESSVLNDSDDLGNHDNQYLRGEDEHVKESPHIMYRRSALFKHIPDNYQTSKDFNRYAKSTKMFHRARRKRSYRSAEPRVETLVVVDQDMYRKHGRENITTYVLSIFNIVSQLYQDPSLGYPIKIVLVGLVFLDGREPGLRITHHADKTLNSFCQWQAGIHNGRQKLHDHAVLLTGKDICSYQDAPCDTLGFAPIDGMCSELRSCIVNEDTGLSTAFTVAHEMGHNFGMMHDGDDNICKDTTGYIMSPTLSAQSGTFHWSPCSRQYMRKYLNAVQSECLTSHSSGTAELKFPNKQPGEIFDADTQCKWQFGSHSKQCTIIFGRDPCKNLFCHKRAGMCETKFLPAAEGTSCGNGMWCQQGKCVRYGKSGPTPINGWWTEWGQWSHCSRSCGGGIKTRTRECNNPRPQYGGKTCQGADAVHKMCNLHECEDGEKNFRAVQCEQLVHEKFRGWNYRWRTHRQRTAIEAEDQCKLYCKADGYNFYYAMPREVTDGTRCNEYTTDICVQGKCQHVGCDLIVSSSARKDRCGVCRGDNSTCKIVENTFTQQPRKNAYVGVVYLPRGSSSINIEEAGIARSNYLALRDRHGEYHLNGNWKLDPEGVYSIAGTKFIYRRPYNLPESLVAEGPLLEDLVLEVLIQSENPGVRYSFTVPRNQHYTPPSLYNFTWSVVLTECSQPCAGGEQIVTAHCHRGKGEEVDPAYCSIDQKPGTGTYACNTQPCRPRWLAEPWSSCHKPCGGGHQKRRVYCVQKLSKTEERRVPRKYCNTKEKPVRKRECNTHECPPVWYKSPWSQCSASCGKGLRSRTVVCRSKTLEGQVVQPDSMCAGVPRPVSQKGCRRRRCPDPTAKWANTAWSECSRTCDVGTRSRAVKCMRKTDSGTVIITKEKRCKHLDKPKITLVEACLVQKCPELPEWYSSPWSTCSVSCGSGKQTRLVHCMHQKYRKLATNCDQSVKPLDTQTCFERKCLDPGPQCLDEFSWCYLRGLCLNVFLKDVLDLYSSFTKLFYDKQRLRYLEKAYYSSSERNMLLCCIFIEEKMKSEGRCCVSNNTLFLE